MDKQVMVPPNDGTVFGNIKKWVLKAWKDMEETYMHTAKWKSQPESLHTVRFQLYNILEKEKLWRQ